MSQRSIRIVCQEVEGGNSCRNSEFGCLCKECVFHDVCWERYMQYFSKCPLCQKSVTVQIAIPDALPTVETRQTRTIVFFGTLLILWSTIISLLLIYGVYLNPYDVFLDVCISCGIINEFENIMIPFIGNFIGNFIENKFSVAIRVQRCICYLVCFIGLFGHTNPEVFTAMFAVTFEMIVVGTFLCCSRSG